MTDVERAPPATATVTGVSPGNEPTNSDNDSDCNQFGGNLSIHQCIRRCLVSTSKQKREGAGPRGPAWRGKVPRETLPPEIQFRRIEGGSKGTVRIPPGPLFLPWDVSEWVIVFGHVVSDALLRTRRQNL